MKKHKGKPRGKTCRWTPELDQVLTSAWGSGGLRSAWKAIEQYQPTWSVHSVRRRAAALQLRRSRPEPWTLSEIDHMLWSIDSNASLALIASRLSRSVGAVRHKLRALGYAIESLGGYKVKDVAEMLSVPPGRVRYWVAEKLLQTKGGRITDASFSKFLADHPQKIPFKALTLEMQNWLREMGYSAGETAPKEASARRS